MKTNEWVASSQRLYRWLLRLYPQSYRTDYEAEMFHLFTDQCREAYKRMGKLGVLSLWLRTLADVGVSVVREHLSDPNSKVGLLEAAPDRPLPWKGVLLVLIPGMIFFASQVEQVTSSNDWFFFAFYRAGYFLILPVLLIWLLTRRFPVWGLIPLGLLYGILRSYTPNYVLYRLYDSQKYFFLKHLSPFELATVNDLMGQGYLMAVSVCVVLLCGLIWYLAHRQQIPRNAWKWLGLYVLLLILGAAGETYNFATFIYPNWPPAEGRQQLFQTPLWSLYSSLPLLLLIFVGVFFAHKYKGFSFLVLLGYLLPAVIFGRYDASQHPVPFYVISLAVLLYRFVVALVAPVWLVRSASVPGRQRAAIIPVAIAILCHVFLNIVVYLAWAKQFASSSNGLNFALNIWSQLIVGAGLGLAVALYLPREKEQIPASPPTLAATIE